jgi:hypothetical protein
MLSGVVAKWADRVEVICARCTEQAANLDAMLVRPDGYVAWARRSSQKGGELRRTLRDALDRWFGAAD